MQIIDGLEIGLTSRISGRLTWSLNILLFVAKYIHIVSLRLHDNNCNMLSHNCVLFCRTKKPGRIHEGTIDNHVTTLHAVVYERSIDVQWMRFSRLLQNVELVHSSGLQLKVY